MTTATRVKTFNIDAVHSTAEFSVKHMMVSNVKGRFREISGTVTIDELEPERSSVEANIETVGVDTGLEMRDNDLRSENFLAVEQYPQMTFRSTTVKRAADERWHVHGDLTIRGQTRPVVLETEFVGRGPDFQGTERIGFTATTSISRKDFGLTYNAVLETGGVVVGDRVKIDLNIEAIATD